VAPQLGADWLRRSDQEILELPLRGGVSIYGGPTGQQPDSECRALLAHPRLSMVLLSERLACRPYGIDRIGLGSHAASGSVGAIHFEDLFSLLP
jgi:hypothetical protein